MNSEEYAEVCQALEKILDLPEAERTLALDEARLSNPKMASELRSLLEADASFPTALQDAEDSKNSPVMQAILQHLAEQESPDELPLEVGPFRIVRVLGQGGMGTVYLGEQEAPIRRRVAVKVVKRGMDSERIVRRFALEREALERMEHPGIARLLDAGVTTEGQPYFAMEYVDGPSILSYCDVNQLTVRARVALLVDTLRALQHAHLRRVLHRDLKPSNILIATVDGKPQPKIIDFGLARAVDSGPEATFATRTGEILGTPAYMSPEQIQGDGKDIDVRSDVYSMGILLFELLTGRRPIDSKGLNAAAAFQLWLERSRLPAPSPSSKVSTKGDDSKHLAELRQCDPRSLQRSLKGELDWVALRAMEAEPERRYASAELFAEDLQAYLEFRTVAAGPVEWSYRSSKFIRRNRVPVAAALLIALSLIVTTLVSVSSAREARASEANSLLAQSEMEEMLYDTKAQNDILYQMLTTPDPRFEGKDTKVVDLLRFGSDYALKTYPDRPSVLTIVMGSLGGNYRELGMFEEAERHLRLALEYQIEADPEAHAQIAYKNNGLGILMRRLGRFAEAEEFFRTAIREYGLARPENQTGAVKTWEYNLGKLLAARGENEEARTWLEKSLASHRAGGDDSHVGTGLIQLTLAEISRSEGEIGEAHEGYRAAVAELKLIDPPAPHFVAAAQVSFGSSLSQAGEWEEARPLLLSALDTARQFNGEKSPNLCHYLCACAENWMRLGDLERAEALILESIEITRASLPSDGLSSANNFEVYARLLLLQGRPAEALPILEGSLAVYEAQLPPDHPSVHALREQIEKLRQ